MTDTRHWSPAKHSRCSEQLGGGQEVGKLVPYPYIAVRLRKNKLKKVSCL